MSGAGLLAVDTCGRQFAGGRFQVSPDEPLELFQLGKLTDNNIFRHGVELGQSGNRCAMIAVDTGVHDIKCAKVLGDAGLAQRVVLPCSAFCDRTRGPHRYASQRCDALCDGVGHLAHGIDLGVEHLVNANEVGTDHIPVNVFQCQLQIDQGNHAVFKNFDDLAGG